MRPFLLELYEIGMFGAETEKLRIFREMLEHHQRLGAGGIGDENTLLRR